MLYVNIYWTYLLESVSLANYLGVDIASDLSWDMQINRISKKANNKLGFLRRNIKIHSESLKYSAYTVLVRPQLEYCSTDISSMTEYVHNDDKITSSRHSRSMVYLSFDLRST